MFGDMSKSTFMIAALIGGLAAGLMGMFAFAELSDRAGAQGYVTRQTEVTLLAHHGVVFQGTPGEEYRDTYASVSIDATKFPDDTTFTLNVSGLETAENSHCFRLAEVVVVPPDTFINPVSGSEVCTWVFWYDAYFARQSDPFTLSSGDHIYMFQWKQANGELSVGLGTIRVLAEWQEYSPAVGGIALLPDIGDSSASNYIALAALAGLVVVAITAGARYARRRLGG
jgi:hypothetical protein